MMALQTLRLTDQHTCQASHTLDGLVELRCGLADHGGGMHCDFGRGIWWMATVTPGG